MHFKREGTESARGTSLSFIGGFANRGSTLSTKPFEAQETAQGGRKGESYCTSEAAAETDSSAERLREKKTRLVWEGT